MVEIILDGTPRIIKLGENTDLALAAAAAADASAVAAAGSAADALAAAPSTYESTIEYGLLVTDAGGRIIGQVPDPALAVLEASANTAEFYESTDVQASAYLLDAGGRIVTAFGSSNGTVSSAEVVAARGSRLSLNDRVSQWLDPYGSPLDSFGANRMRRYHMKRRKLLLGEDARLPIAIFGDSNSHLAARWTGDYAATEVAAYGDGGGGWTGFGFGGASGTFTHGGTQPTLINGNARPSSYGVSFSGAWNKTYGSVPAPDTCCAVSSTAGDEIRATFPASPTLSGVDLFWIGTADGVMEYSWNGSSWTTINVQGTVGACSSAALAGVPGSGPGTLYLRVVSGTCQPAGVNWKSAANGVVIHKLAATGTRMQQLATQAATTSWRTAIAALEVDSALVAHMSNDQVADRAPSDFAADATTVIGGLRAAVPGLDVLAISVPANQQTGQAYPMTAYKAAYAPVAAELDTAFLDLQRNFGDPENPDEYGASGATPLFNVDGLHMEPSTGGPAWLDGLLRFLASA